MIFSLRSSQSSVCMRRSGRTDTGALYQELIRKEQELQEMTMVLQLSHGHVKPVPVKRRKYLQMPFTRRLSKKDIGLPETFRHVLHLGAQKPAPALSLDLAAPHAVTTSTALLRGEEWGCPACSYLNPVHLTCCEMCDGRRPPAVAAAAAAAAAEPVPPRRNAPPSLRQNSSDALSPVLMAHPFRFVRARGAV